MDEKKSIIGYFDETYYKRMEQDDRRNKFEWKGFYKRKLKKSISKKFGNENVQNSLECLIKKQKQDKNGWQRGFMVFPATLSLRKPYRTSLSESTVFNEVMVDKFSEKF